jgi:hypothetical protein
MVAFLLSGMICLLAAGLVLRINKRRQPEAVEETGLIPDVEPG